LMKEIPKEEDVLDPLPNGIFKNSIYGEQRPLKPGTNTVCSRF